MKPHNPPDAQRCEDTYKRNLARKGQRCRNRAFVTVDGKRYCYHHDPQRVTKLSQLFKNQEIP